MIVMTDDFVRPQLRHRNIRIAEIDRHHRHEGRFGGRDVGLRVADHDGAAEIAASAAERAQQGVGVGFLHREGVLPADRRKPAGKAQTFEKPYRQPLELVGANRARAAAPGA